MVLCSVVRISCVWVSQAVSPWHDHVGVSRDFESLICLFQSNYRNIRQKLLAHGLLERHACEGIQSTMKRTKQSPRAPKLLRTGSESYVGQTLKMFLGHVSRLAGRLKSPNKWKSELWRSRFIGVLHISSIFWFFSNQHKKIEWRSRKLHINQGGLRKSTFGPLLQVILLCSCGASCFFAYFGSPWICLMLCGDEDNNIPSGMAIKLWAPAPDLDSHPIPHAPRFSGSLGLDYIDAFRNALMCLSAWFCIAPRAVTPR